MTRSVREQIAECAARHPDMSATGVLGALGLEPTDEHLELAREAVAARDRLAEREAGDTAEVSR